MIYLWPKRTFRELENTPQNHKINNDVFITEITVRVTLAVEDIWIIECDNFKVI